MPPDVGGAVATTSAAPSAGPVNSAPANGGNSGTPSAPKTGPAAGRSNDGKFLPKQGEDVAKAASSEPEKPKGFKFKLKVDGREEEAEYATEADLVRDLQMSRSAASRMREAAKNKQEHQALLERLKSSPLDVLTEHGADFDKLAAERLASQARRGMMSPEQREAEDMKAQFETQKKELEALKTAENQRALAKYEEAVWSEMEPQFLEALEKAGLPKDQSFMAELAQIGTEFLDANLNVSPADIVAELNRRETLRVWDRVRASGPAAIAKRLGPEIVRAIAEDYTRQFIESRRQSKTPRMAAPSLQPAEGRISKYIDPDEFKRSMKDFK